MENKKSTLNKIIEKFEEFGFLGNLEAEKIKTKIENENENRKIKPENYISQNIYILSPN